MFNEKEYEVMRKMMEAVYQERGLDYLVEFASEMMGNPVYILDVADRFIATCKQLKTDDTYLKQMVENGYINEFELSKMRRKTIKNKINKMDTSFFIQREENQNFIFCPIRLHKELIAYTASFNLNREFDNSDLELFNIINKAFTIELQKSRFYQDNKVTDNSQKLKELLTLDRQKFPNRKIDLFERKMKKYTYLLFISSENPNNDIDLNQKFRVMLVELHNSLQTDLVITIDGGIVLLLSLPKPFSPGSERYERIAELLSINSLFAGCSKCISDINSCPKHFEEAKEAYRLGQLIKSDYLITYYNDVMPFHLMSILEKEYLLDDLRHSGCVKLEEYDKLHSTEYCNTLQAYLNNAQSPTATCKQLNIHKNTLYYRLSVIKEIIDNDLHDLDTIAHIALTYKINTYMNCKLRMDRAINDVYNSAE